MNVSPILLSLHQEISTTLVSVTGESLGMDSGWASLHQIERAGKSKGLNSCSLEVVNRVIKERLEKPWSRDNLTHRMIMNPIEDDTGWPCIFGFSKEGIVSSRGEPHAMIWLTHCQFVFSVKKSQITASCLKAGSGFTY